MKTKLTRTGLLLLIILTLGFLAYQYHVNTMKSAEALDWTTVQKLGVDRLREYYKIPGFSYSVVKNGQVVKTGASGYIFDGAEQAVSTESIFQIGSCTKAFTALIAARLVEDGLLRWDTGFFALFPEWEDSANPVYHTITLKDLLSHNAGVQPFTRNVEDTKLPLTSANPIDRRLEFCQYVLTLPPVAEGEDPYSNAGYSLAAVMLEKVTGQSWEELAELVAADIGITIGFGRPNASDRNQPWGHRIGWFRQLRPVPPEDYHIPFVIAPAGDLHMSVLDMSNYIQLYLDGLAGRDGYLEPETCRYLLFGEPGYSMGWNNRYDGETYAFHSGSDGTFNAHVMIWKELDAAVIILTNAPDCEDTAHFIDDIRNYLKWRYIYQ